MIMTLNGVIMGAIKYAALVFLCYYIAELIIALFNHILCLNKSENLKNIQDWVALWVFHEKYFLKSTSQQNLRK